MGGEENRLNDHFPDVLFFLLLGFIWCMWCGLVLCGVVWHGMVWCGVVWHGRV